jgi:hypothetical protein
MSDAPFTLPPSARAALDTAYPDGMPVQEVARRSPQGGLTVAAMESGGILLRHDNRAYIALAITPDGKVADRKVIEGEDAAELDRRLWFTFRGLRDKIAAELVIGARVRDVIAAIRSFAPIALDHLTTVYRKDLGSLRMYHFVGGGVIALEVDPGGVITATNLLPPKVGQGSVVALAAQDRDAPPAWDAPRSSATVRAALDDVLGRGADPIGVRELDPRGDTIEITGRSDDGTWRYRFHLGGSGRSP